MRAPKNPRNRRVQLSVPQRYLVEAGAVGCADIEEYIEALKTTIRNQAAAIEAAKAAHQDGDGASK